MNQPGPEPALLVSVRSAREAKTALRGGARVIDCKEPAVGPLGRCPRETWQEIQEFIKTRAALSAALGEWHDWADLSDDQVRLELQSLARFQFAKLGPAGSVGRQPEFFETFQRLMALGPASLRWVCVVYADEEAARSIDRAALLQFAVKSHCAGLLIDTFDKTRANTWGRGWMGFCRSVKRHKLQLALAGGLTAGRIRALKELQPDWFAVRGAACQHGTRTGRVSFRNVRRLVQGMKKAQIKCNQ